MKKLFLLTTFIALTIFGSIGCMTKQIWTDKTIIPNYGHSYKETIVSFYNNPNEEQLIFIGNKYHYIFDEDTKNFINLLQIKDTLKLSQENLNIHAYVNRTHTEKITAMIHIKFEKSKLEKNQIALLESHYFERDPNNNYRKQYKIQGTRYLANTTINQKVLKLKQPIDLNISAPEVINRSTLKKIAMTPLTLTADALGGVLLVGAGIVMSPIWLFQEITK